MVLFLKACCKGSSAVRETQLIGRLLRMKAIRRSSWILLVAAASLLLITACKDKTEQANISTPPPTATMTEPTIGGQKVIVLRRSRTGDGTHPEFLSVTLLPGRGMNVLQITAW